MIKKQQGKLDFWQFEIFGGQSNLIHFVTDRKGGVSQGKYGSLNVSYNSGDHFKNVKENRQIIASSLDIPMNHLLLPGQIHSSNIKIVSSRDSHLSLKDTDALITKEPGYCIAVSCADCVPILLFDPLEKVVAAIHAGWRGTVSRIVEKTLVKMKTMFHCDFKNVLAAIGPSISMENYVVGSEVMNVVEENFGRNDKILVRISENQAKLDLWEANKVQLLGQGLKESNIQIAGICTYSNNNFFSARGQGKKCGRFSAGIMLKLTR